MTRRRFQQIDVFGSSPFSGNPLAVVHDAEGIPEARLRAISEWTNLSETTFLLPPSDPEADYRVRIFALGHELPFAGHPTLGSARAWLAAGGTPRRPGLVVQESPIGLVPVRIDGEQLAFAAPPLRRSGEVEASQLQRVLGVLGLRRDQIVDAAWIDNGPGWIGVLLADAERVLQLEPDASGVEGGLDIGVIGAYPADAEAAFELRAFFRSEQGPLREDPVTGSLNAAAAQWLIASGRARAPYTASQGTRLGRAGRIQVDAGDGELWIGGTTRVVITGEIDPD